jgi:citronellol/citronellal dehydrogenase
VGTLDGKVALVTGASRGIGASIAARLAAEGASVAALARTLEPDPKYVGCLADTISQITQQGGRAVPVQADLSKSEDRERAVSEAVDQLGPIDILVNNAAVTFLQQLVDFSEKRFRLMVEVQLWAPMHLCQLVLPSMYDRGSGSILNISSRAALLAEGPPFDEVQTTGYSVYGMVKAGLERMTNALAAEAYSKGVRANSLSPWDIIATPGTATHKLLDGHPMEDQSVLVEAALQLCTGDITGRAAYSQQLLKELGVAY